MSDLNMAHKKIANTSGDKFNYQLIMIQLNQTNRSKTNDTNMKTKNPKNNTSKWNLLRKLTLRSNLFLNVLNLNRVTIIKVGF